ncbi:MAG: hypothetical protein EHM45_02070, partial [Desulfobacteraceae bacterium]
MRPINLAICTAGELYGGIEQFIYAYAELLNKHDRVKPIVVLFNKGLLYERLKQSGIDLYMIDSNYKYDFSCLRKIVGIFRNKKINLVHTHAYKANILCGLAARYCRIKALKTEHGMLEPAKGLNFIKMSLNLFADQWIVKSFFSGIVFVTNDIKSIPEKKLFTIH